MTDQFAFMKATKRKSKLRLALIGPSGSGKTFTALTIAPALGNKIAVIDTERGSASKYADLFSFDVLELDTFSPMTYADAIHAAENAGYEVVIIDSLSHAWSGKEGALEQVDKATARSQSKNSYTAWRDVTPMHNSLIDAMIQSKCHVIATMRTKTEYVMEKDERTGKTAPRKVGLAPIQRDGMEYEFDVVADMDLDNTLIVSKTRCPAVNGAVVKRPSIEFGKTLSGWLVDGAEPARPEPKPEPKKNGAAPMRPYLPDYLKYALDKNSSDKKHSGRKATPEQIGLVAGMLDAIFMGDKDKRHTVQKYLLGAASLKDVRDGLVLATLDWLKPTVDDGGQYTPDPIAAKEAEMVWTEAIKAEGQEELL